MKKRTKILLFILLGLPLCNIIFYSCCDCDVEKFHGTYINKSLTLFHMDNSGKDISESESGKVNRNAYGIRIQLVREEFEAMPAQQTCHINSLFMASAYAMHCDCDPHTILEPRDSIISLKIFTLNDFNDEKPAASDVSEYFRLSESFSPIGTKIEWLNHDIYDGYNLQEVFDILLMTAPAADNTKHAFKVQFTLSSGSVIEQVTDEIELQ